MIRVKVNKHDIWKAYRKDGMLWIDEVPEFIELDAEPIEEEKANCIYKNEDCPICPRVKSSNPTQDKEMIEEIDYEEVGGKSTTAQVFAILFKLNQVIRAHNCHINNT